MLVSKPQQGVGVQQKVLMLQEDLRVSLSPPQTAPLTSEGHCHLVIGISQFPAILPISTDSTLFPPPFTPPPAVVSCLVTLHEGLHLTIFTQQPQ